MQGVFFLGIQIFVNYQYIGIHQMLILLMSYLRYVEKKVAYSQKKFDRIQKSVCSLQFLVFLET